MNLDDDEFATNLRKKYRMSRIWYFIANADDVKDIFDRSVPLVVTNSYYFGTRPIIQDK